MGGPIQSAILTGTSLRGGGITTTAAIIAIREEVAVSRLAAEPRLVGIPAADTDILTEAAVNRLLSREASRPVIRLIPLEASRLVEASNLTVQASLVGARRRRLRRTKAEGRSTRIFLR